MDWVLKKIIADENDCAYFYKTELPYNIGKHTNTTNCSVCQAIDHQMVIRYRDCKGGNCTVYICFYKSLHALCCSLGINYNSTFIMQDGSDAEYNAAFHVFSNTYVLTKWSQNLAL
jgi:hypothetical protein